TRKARVIVLRDRQDLVERLEQRPLAEPRRHHGIDDPIVEIVAGDREPGMADRGRGDTVAAPLEADQREIAGATAKVANEDQRIGGEAPRIIKRSANRLVDIGWSVDADAAIGFAVALDRQRFVRRSADKGNRPPRNDATTGLDRLS